MKALILGPSGRASRAVAESLGAKGWELIAFDRKTDFLDEKARDVDVIVYGWNPPYDQWAKTYLAMTDAVVGAARINNATIFFPGNVYVYGEEPAPWREDTPHHPINALGEIRANVETKLAQAEVQTIILRAGDFIDTQPSGNWFDAVMTKKLKRGILTYPGQNDAKHAWAYLPDFGEAAAMLIEMRAQLSDHEVLNFSGYTLTGNQLRDALQTAIHKPVKLTPMRWAPIRMASPFLPMARSLYSMRYLWDFPHELNGEKMRALLPDFKATPFDEALARATRSTLQRD